MTAPSLRPSRLLLPAAVYAAILVLSSVPGSEYEQLQLPAELSYLAHALEYGALGAALRWSLDGVRWPLALTVGLGALLGAGDEALQSTVPGRDPALLDLAVDVTAVVLAAVFVARWLRRRAGR